MKALFLLQILCLIIGCVTLFLKKESKMLKLVKVVALALNVVLGLAVFLFEPTFSSVSLGISIFTVISFLIHIFASGKGAKEGLKNTAKFVSKAILIILILEALVFNFNSFHVMSKDYEEFSLSISEGRVENLAKESGGYKLSEDNQRAVIEFTDINEEIGTIFFDVDSLSPSVSYSIDFSDESNSSYYIRQGLVEGEIFPEIEDSKYVICNFSGDVSKIKISLEATDGDFTLPDTIDFNKDHPSTFSILRMLIFLAFAVFVFLFIKSVYLNRSIKEQKDSIKHVTALVVLVLLLIMMFMTTVASIGQDIFHLTTGNQMTQELVDAFKDGRVTLDTVPSDELLALENPYDWSQRTESGVDALWDHVMYEGEYYSYYGIGPVLLLFLPYNLITGYYFPSTVATFLFSAVGLVFLALTFMKLSRRYFSDIPLSMYLVSLIMILSTCGIWYCILPSNFYEIAQTSGFCFVTLGAYFLVSSNLLSAGKIRLLPLALSSLFLAIAVTCRPTTAVWCVVALLFIGAGVIKLYREHKEKKKSSVYVKYLLSALVPFAVIGAMQMIYNYIRFDSVFDFGIQYSLTINDFTKAQYHTQFAAIGFYNYLLAPPSFSSHFPFVVTNITDLDVNGYYFTATNNGCGLFFRALPMFALFLSPCALKYVSKKNRVLVSVLFSAVAFVAPFIVIFSVWESGYGVRYMVDFAWQMLMCALFVVFLLYQNTKYEETKKIYRYAMLVFMFLCVIVNFALVYAYIYPNNLPLGAYTIFERFARAFCIFNT